MLDFDPDNYSALLDAKCDRVEAMFASFDPPSAQRVPSPPSSYRLRAEFRIWHQGDDLFYAMFDRSDPKTPVRVEHFPIAGERIQEAMPALRAALLPSESLRRKLFQVEFLSTLSGELLITLVYHRPLDADWERAARELENDLGAHLIGRSRKQKLVLSRDHVEEVLHLDNGEYRYRQYEQGFTQPNGEINREMINWACAQASGIGGDLLELYCGNGNFTLPLATHFDRVLATEVAKRSIAAALHNRTLNNVNNLEFARLSAEEMASALAGEREFRRLRSLETDLADYQFSTIFVDPPRAGLDVATTALAARFDNILYISCNPETLVRNLEELCRTHRIEALALFDQFPYTDHMECGVSLKRL
jgi:tRNA (uracil-5-)-methyltransferase